MVGTSGNDATRLAPNSAEALELAGLDLRARRPTTDDTSTCALLPSTAVSAGPPPLVGRWRILSAGRLHEQRGRQMQRAVKARRREDDLVGTFLGVVDQVLQRLLGLLVVDDQHASGSATSRAIGMKSARVNFGWRSNSLSTCSKPEIETMCDQDRVAVRLGDGGRLARRPGRRRRLWYRRCTGCLMIGSSSRRHRAADHVGSAAGRKRVDEGDGARRIGFLRKSRARCESSSGGSAAHDEVASIHEILPGCVTGVWPVRSCQREGCYPPARSAIKHQ